MAVRLLSNCRQMISLRTNAGETSVYLVTSMSHNSHIILFNQRNAFCQLLCLQEVPVGWWPGSQVSGSLRARAHSQP